MDEFNNKNSFDESVDESNENLNKLTDEEAVTQNEDFEQQSFDESEQPEEEFHYNAEVKQKKRINPLVVALSSALVICLIVGSVFAFNMPELNKNSGNNAYHSSNVSGQKSDVKKTSTNEQFIPTGDELSTTEIAAKVGPTIVGIVNTSTAVNFFNQQTESTSSGSGVILTEDGYIITNNHVIEGANKVKVMLNSGKEYQAKVVGSDSRSDIAVIKIEEKNLPYATIGDSSKVMVGDKAVAIGNPLGTELMGTVTQGIISAVNRTVTVENKTLTLLQTDAAINAGNSGGALVNCYGEVIGINTIKMSATGVEGIGFAIPSNEFKPVIDDLVKHGYVTGRLMIGVAGTNITDKLAEYYDLPEGFYVNQVYQGYGAYLAGMQSGDVIIKCDGKVTKTIDDINAIRDKHKVGDTMNIVVSRNGNNVTLKVKLMEEKPEITNQQ